MSLGQKRCRSRFIDSGLWIVVILKQSENKKVFSGIPRRGHEENPFGRVGKRKGAIVRGGFYLCFLSMDGRQHDGGLDPKC
jgi:hypothetical protein